MKKPIFLLSAIAFMAIVSCSDSDSDNATDVSGIYELTSVVAPVAVDLNDDGTPSNNLLSESTCYDNSAIVLNGDHTYTLLYSYATVLDGATAVSCTNIMGSGNWERSGANVILTDSSEGTAFYIFSENTLSQVGTAQYPNINGSGDAYLATGNVGVVFTRTN